MDIDMVESRETNNIVRLTNWRRNAKSKFQGVHDRFLRDQEFRIRMIENHRQGSNTMPLTHRPDFKQALSTLQRLQKEAREEPQVPTYSYKHQQWGGTKFIFYIMELARFMVDSLSFRKSRRRCTKYWVNGATRCLQHLASFFEKNFHEFNLLCYRWIVYSWRRSTVTDGGCKYRTSNDVFSGCKMCTK